MSGELRPTAVSRRQLCDTGASTRALVDDAQITTTSQKPPEGTQHPSGVVFQTDEYLDAEHGQDRCIDVQDR